MYEYHDHIRQLVLEKLTGTISAEDDSRLVQLLENDPVARDLWVKLNAQASGLDLQGVLGRADDELALESLHRKLRPKRSMSRILQWSAAAAALVMAVTGAWYYKQQYNAAHPVVITNTQPGVKLLLANGQVVTLSADGQQRAGNTMLQTKNNELHYTPGNDAAEVFNTLVIPAKEDYKIVLSDGTEVWLNSASHLRFPFAFNGERREVYLEGEAYFKVAHRAAQPFIVHTPHTDIRVLGTSFNINTYDNKRLRASLVEGKIAAYADGDSVKLQPGMEVLSDGGRLRTAYFDQSATLAWMDGLYYFSNIPLEQITGILHRWFDVKVVFEDPATAKAMVSGVIEKGRMDDFLENLRVATGTRYHWKAGVLYLK